MLSVVRFGRIASAVLLSVSLALGLAASPPSLPATMPAADWAPAPARAESGFYASRALVADGGSLSVTAAADTWAALPSAGAPSPRSNHTAVWTGSEMIVWAGTGPNNAGFNNGARYNPSTRAWTSLPSAAAPSGGQGWTAVWTGSEMIVWAYGGGRYNPSANAWTALSASGAPSGRNYHTAVWTGSEMIVWGGNLSGPLGDGARYSPSTDSWNPLPSAGAPSPRDQHTAVWTGSEMIVWGGFGPSGSLNDGARYHPSTDAWTPLSSIAPSGRGAHSAAWTGTEMVVWGGGAATHHVCAGCYPNSVLNDGGRYDPRSDTWTPLASAGAPSARYSHSAVWTGSEMIVWGGVQGYFGQDGARYGPGPDAWAAMPSSGAPCCGGLTATWTGTEMLVCCGASGGGGSGYNPSANTWRGLPGGLSNRWGHTAVWTGSEMIVWGGSSPGPLNDGALYNPSANTWRPLPGAGAPSARSNHTAVWTGSEMIVWGGCGLSCSPIFGDGARYNPSTNAWTALPSTGAPSARHLHTAVWTESGMIIWGGSGLSGVVNTGAHYNPTTDTWTPLSSIAPSARGSHSAVWTGSEMIVWGGSARPGAALNDGGRYTPSTNAWRGVSGAGAPTPRSQHSAVWTGSEMIVFGGWGAPSGSFNDGARYNPSANTWTALPSAGAPGPRYWHAAEWTGSEMIVWGGHSELYFGNGAGYVAAGGAGATPTPIGPPGTVVPTATRTAGAAATGLAFFSPPADLTVGVPSSAFTVVSVNASGTPTPVSADTTVTFSSSPAGTFTPISISFPAGSFGNLAPGLPNGPNSVRFTAPAAGRFTITARAPGLASASITVTAVSSATPPTATSPPSATPPTATPPPSATPTGPVSIGGRGLGLRLGPPHLSWTPGSAQSGYYVVRLAGSTSTVLPPGGIPLPADAGEYTDTSGPRDPFLCYLVVPLGPPGAVGLSDLLCGLPGTRSLGGAPGNFTIRLNQSSTATLTWTAPAQVESYNLLAVPLGPGAVPRQRRIPVSATQTTEDTGGIPTCFVLQPQVAGTTFGSTDILCGVPGISTLRSGRAPAG